MRSLAAAVVALAATGLGGPVGLVAAAGAAPAHTESDLVAVAAGDTATVTLQPTHGCGASPTVQVDIRAPVAGATPVDVPGWTATATPDGDRTRLSWSGGVLPADQTGAFPVRFTVPDAVGELLTFPAVQTCEDGTELAWIDGDPDGEYPAPRLLVLPPGSPSAATIDDVPPDAPGRDQLTAIVDVDNPDAAQATTTTAAAATSTTLPATTTTAAADDLPADASDDPAEGTGDDRDDGSAAPLLVGAVVVVAALGAAWWAVRGRRPARP